MKTLLGIFLSVVLFLGLVILFNIGNIDIQFDELHHRIGDISNTENAVNDLGILSRYESILRNGAKSTDDLFDSEPEEPLDGYTVEHLVDNRAAVWKRDALAIPIRYGVHAIQFLLGKTAIRPREDAIIIGVLEIGYCCERNRRFYDALDVYDAAIATIGVSTEIKAAMLAHKAFCLSMLGKYGESRGLYEQAITLFPDSDAGMLSWKLLEYIRLIERNIAFIQKQPISALKKGDRLYLLSDYRGSIKNYSMHLTHASVSETTCKATYYKGRAHEELGETTEAMNEYREVRRIDKNGQWAKLASRRILAIGNFDEKRKLLLDAAKRRLEAYRDEVFLTNVPHYAKFVSGSALRATILRIPNERRFSPIDSILAVSLNINALDASDKVIASTQQRKIDSVRHALLELSAAGQSEIKNQKRWLRIMDCPPRRPAELQSTIKGQSSALTRIRAKRIMSGATVSGALLVSIEIKTTGAVGNVSVLKSNISDQPFEAIVLSRIRDWKFPPVHDDIGTVAVHYPFTFND